MRYRFLALTLLVTAACGTAAPADPGPDVWAVVNGTQINRARVERFYNSMLASSQGTPSEEEALGAKLGLLDELITDELVLARGAELKIVPTSEEVDAAVAERRGTLSDDDFAKQLQDRKTTAEEFREEVTRELIKAKVIEQEVASKVTVTDDDVTAFFESNREQFNVPEKQYHLAQIVVTSTPTPVNNQQNDDARSPGEAQRKLAMLMERLQGGESFAVLAANFSEDPQSAPNGGDLGLIPQSRVDQAAPSLRRAVTSMKPGDMNTITNADVTTLLALVRVLEAGQRTLDEPEVKDSIRTGLQDRRQQLLESAYLARLRDEATIVNYLARRVFEAEGKLPDVAAAR